MTQEKEQKSHSLEEDDELIKFKQSLRKTGTVSSIVDDIIVIESEEHMPPLDIDSVLFKEDGTKLGLIDDVFGPIKRPMYSIKKHAEEIEKNNISKDMPVFFVPQTDRSLTKFVFIDQLEKLHIASDASWQNDDEPPEEALDYSDDEQEREAKKKKRDSQLQKNASNTPVV